MWLDHLRPAFSYQCRSPQPTRKSRKCLLNHLVYRQEAWAGNMEREPDYPEYTCAARLSLGVIIEISLTESDPSPAMRELVVGVESQRADPRLRASAEKSVISLSPTHQITHANAISSASSHVNASATQLVARQRFRNAISSASTHQSTHVNAFPPRISRAPPRKARTSTRSTTSPTTQSTRANASTTHANANEKSARKFGERNFGNGIDDRFDDRFMIASVTGSMKRNFVAENESCTGPEAPAPSAHCT